MAQGIALKLQPRDVAGKKVKRLRQAGFTPVHLYGLGIPSLSLQCQQRDLVKVLTRAGRTTPITITVEGEAKEQLAFVREIQWDPIRGDLYHVDFVRVDVAQVMAAEVPVVLEGDSPGARMISGSVAQQLHSLTIQALPLEMPQEIRVDLSLLAQPDSVLRAGEVLLPPGATLLTDPEAAVVRVEAPRLEEVREGAAVEAQEEQPAGEQEEG